jgi:hypothetical protein
MMLKKLGLKTYAPGFGSLVAASTEGDVRDLR